MGNRRLVHVIDDEVAVRDAAAFMLRHAGYDVATYPSGEAFLQTVDSVRPGCILLDVRMPGIDGLELQQELAGRGITMPIVVVTGHGDIRIAVQAMKAGAVDFVQKPYQRDVLLPALEGAFDRFEQVRVQGLKAAEASALVAKLTAREHDVLNRLAQGSSNKTIAHDLGISPRTVEIHRANMMEKLGASSLSAALRIAFAAGLGAETRRH